MRALYLVLVVLLVLVAAFVLAGGPLLTGPRVRLTSDAKAEFAQWMRDHPKAREREQRCTGIRDITLEPDRFFAVELKEPEHSDVAAMVRAAGGVMDAPILRRWLAENSDEVYARNITACI